ncbi:MAG TPA: 30S ribosomal protein S20 [Candidatus Dormibacteraeota bacterium]|nr:30S ribosomal protein S20 [Candidatus Dormibacteraeota bacterium]
MPAGTPVKVRKKKKSVLKNIRQTERRTVINRSNRSIVATAVKKQLALIAGGKLDEARDRLPVTYAVLDRAIQKRVLHENTANRYKSRLTLALNTARAASTQKPA